MFLNGVYGCYFKLVLENNVILKTLLVISICRMLEWSFFVFFF